MEPPRDGKAVPPAAAAAGTEGEPLLVASHRLLFAGPKGVSCDACGAALLQADEDEDGYRVAGEGVYMWTRGDQVRFDRAPLCPDCASVISMTALGRWEIEEEEG